MDCPSCGHDNIPGVDLCENCGLDLAGLDVRAWTLDPEDPFLSKSMADLPLKRPLILPPHFPVSEAIELMKNRHEGCVFVQDDPAELLGVLTEHDVAARIAAPGRDPEETRIDEVMTRNPVSLQKNDPLAWALNRMGVDGYRHLPILENRRLIGFLSVRTVLRALLEA